MNAVCLVAHPDDCVIFAWPFIEAYSSFRWTIVYMTYHVNEHRAQEIKAYWDRRDIQTVFLGHRDDYLDQQTGRFNFWNAGLVGGHTKKCVEKLNPDLILTHNVDGDYGHIHHMLVHEIANTIDVPKVYFASTFNYNTKYYVQNSVAVDELPIHREVVEGFQDRDTGLYIVSEEAKQIL